MEQHLKKRDEAEGVGTADAESRHGRGMANDAADILGVAYVRVDSLADRIRREKGIDAPASGKRG